VTSLFANHVMGVSGQAMVGAPEIAKAVADLDADRGEGSGPNGAAINGANKNVLKG
jgi:hypothetical protein